MKYLAWLAVLVLILSACSVVPQNNFINRDYCGSILSETSARSPYIRVAKAKGRWYFSGPITLVRETQCDAAGCYSGTYKAGGTKINAVIKYGGYLGENNIEVSYSYLDRKANGTGTCNASVIDYSYVFTEGRPKGKKGFAQIYSKEKILKKQTVKTLEKRPQVLKQISN